MQNGMFYTVDRQRNHVMAKRDGIRNLEKQMLLLDVAIVGIMARADDAWLREQKRNSLAVEGRHRAVGSSGSAWADDEFCIQPLL